ncbi:electron transporter SenC [Sphingobium sp. Leaf26]|uniref:SCO family protein n=1 Tax=Sphingobium sp. Leaf26 TaxID=1735693 RepID=UPI0006FB41A3|nr:SCO family protein [Sphingobium sp. Leaf26]KQN07092.1 electron transporter SenC [Sphingobium sp. Leaf26]
MAVIEPKMVAAAGPTRRARVIVFGLVAILLLGLGVLIAMSAYRDDGGAVQGSGPGGAFTLTDPAGRTVTDQTLRGKPYAIFFGFTRCPDVCPTTLSRMTQLRKQMGAQGMKYNIVFVSVDPGHDKPADIGNYLTLFGTPIIGLTGTDAQIAQITKAYGVYFRQVPVEGGDYTIDHMAGIMLFDRNGRFAEMMDGTEPIAVSLTRLRKLISA